MPTSTRSGARLISGSPGTKPSSSPPVTRNTETGNRERAATTRMTPNARSSAKSWSSPWAVMCTAHDDISELGYLGRVGEVFVLRELAQCLGLDLAHALARQ